MRFKKTAVQENSAISIYLANFNLPGNLNGFTDASELKKMTQALSRSLGIIFVILLLNCNRNGSSISEIDRKYLKISGHRLREIGESSSVLPINILELSQNSGDKDFEKWLVKNKDYIKMPLKGQLYHSANFAHPMFEFTPPNAKVTHCITVGGAYNWRDH